jgi:hypothetical protein
MKPLLQRLIDIGLVSREKIEHALIEAAKINKSIWFCLVKWGYVSEEQLMAFFAQELNIPFVRISDYVIREEALCRVDEYFCRQNSCVPIFHLGENLYMAFSNPLNAALLESVAKISGCQIEPLMATYSSIHQALDFYWRLDEKYFEAADFWVRQDSAKGIPFWRESERLSLSVQAQVSVPGHIVEFFEGDIIKGQTKDISRDGSAVGISLPMFIPKGIFIDMEFLIPGQAVNSVMPLKAQGEVVHCFMRKYKEFILGVKLINFSELKILQLLRLAKKE